MRPGRNEPCRCGSGRKYKHCHLPIDEAPLERQYEVAQQVYARNWTSTAQAHYQAGRYNWMAERLLPFAPRRILDVGCGSGHGISTLFDVLGNDLQVLSLDENGACIDIAARTLAQTGVDACSFKRLTPMITAEGFAFDVAPLEGTLDVKCALIQGDICNDPGLIHALINDTPFDAVTIWLTGTHMMRQFHRDVRCRGIDSDGSHRLYVQNSVYEVADKVLRSGGVLQVADRTEAPMTDGIRNDYLDAHREQASVTSLEVTELEYLVYDEPKTLRTPMVVTPGQSGRIPKNFQISITSIVSLKP